MVAGEVRNLAQRSSASAREIKELIESSIKFVEKGAGQADEVGQNMGDMNEAISQVADLVNEIAAAAHEQMQGIGQVHQAVNQMDDVTQQNAALVQEASAASHSLMEQATVLNELVATFVIKVPSELKSKDAISASGVKLSSSHGTTVKKKTAGLEENWKSF